ncbi:hypothetical protein EIL87_19730, partial [Saccharopolyspora rhizosphaerae]
MGDSNAGGLLAAAVIGVVVIGAAQGQSTDQQAGSNDTPVVEATSPSGGGDVILGTHSGGNRGDLTHYAYCGPAGTDPVDAEYQVVLREEDEEMAYRDVEGQPCPDGPREETAFQQYPGL